MSSRTHSMDGPAAARHVPSGPGHAAGVQLPPDVPPTVGIRPITATVVAGQPVSVTVTADQGTHWFIDPEGDPDSKPIVTYTGTTVVLDATVVASGQDAGGTFTVTFPRPGDHLLQASCTTNAAGTVVTSAQVLVRVRAAGPPTFTVISPEEGASVDLNEGGGSVDVTLSIPPDEFFPLDVEVTRDEVTTTSSVTSTDYTTKITLTPLPLGPRPITIQVADRDGQASGQTISVNGLDVAAPHLVVEFPPPSANVVGDATGNATVSMHGTAADAQSGMAGGSAEVAWALSPDGPRTAAQAVTDGDFTAWRADVLLPGFGAHTIHVWATDAAGNTRTAPLAVPVDVISSYVPGTLEERLDEREYLAALLAFAQEQVTVSGAPATPLDTPTLVAALGQPMDRLSQPLSAASDRGRQEINQLRVPVELLRARIAETHAASGPGAAAEAEYRATAYATLLGATGTSYTELRLARAATPEVRLALATRLGIGLSPTGPDELDRLTLDENTRTEAALEAMFGLPDTTAADPLRVPPTPQLLTWQLAALTARWAREDQHPTLPRAFAAVADPDVVGIDDVVTGPAGDLVRALLARRAAVLNDYATTLDQLRSTAPDAQSALAAMVAKTLPGIDLAALETRDRQGIDIAPDLIAAGLTRTGFRCLRTVDRLAGAKNVTPAEWADTIAVLTAAHKQTLISTWRAEETAFVLSPDTFAINSAGPAVNPYRVDAQARSDWRSVLRARIMQRQDVLDASAAAVAAAEQAALPILRDGLLADLAAAVPGTDVGEQLSGRYFADMLAGGSLRTTRIRQAIESVQALLLAKRSGELAADHPASGWAITDPTAFSNAWVWMGEWGSWRSATQAFLFPERHLDPAQLTPVIPGSGRQLTAAASEAVRHHPRQRPVQRRHRRPGGRAVPDRRGCHPVPLPGSAAPGCAPG